MIAEKNKAIAAIIPLIVKNNAGRIAISLKEAGYSNDFIPVGELEARLFQLYTANPVEFFEILKNIPWNNGQSETNRPAIKDELIKLVSQNGGEQVSSDNWWPELITMLSQESPVQQRTVTPPSTSSMLGYGIGILLVLAAIGLIIGLIYLFRS